MTDALCASFALQGAVVVRGFFGSEQIELLKAGIEKNLANPSSLMTVASQAGDQGRFVEDFCNWQRIPEYHEFIFDKRLAALAARLMGSNQVRLYHDHLLVKEPNTRQRTPWHQDQPYYNVQGQQNLSMWIPVDPIPRESTLEFLSGSHTGPWLMPRTFLSQQAKWFPEGSLTEVPNIDADPKSFSILGWALEPGDLVCFHMLALHGAAGTGPAHRRRVFSVRFLGDDMRHAPRPWRTSPPFEGLDQQLPAGAVMDHPLFPILPTS
jgi:ectoine hydroxylase-related dioxygenase (phytanoyl-CoA dioxygenase family)